MKRHEQFAVFPLPKLVAYPGHSLQFHIFEPRYRKMIKDCVDQNLCLGVALGELTSKGKVHSFKTVENFLKSNQENYHPSQVFGAGPVRVLEKLPDDRYLIEVIIENRIRSQEAIQQIPYIKVVGEVLEDIEPSSRSLEIEIFDRLLGKVVSLLGNKAKLATELISQKTYSTKKLNPFVYEMLRWFILEPSEGQRLLETDSVAERAEILEHWLNHVSEIGRKTEPLLFSSRDGNGSAENIISLRVQKPSPLDDKRD